MKIVVKIQIVLAVIFISSIHISQGVTTPQFQTIRGRVIDLDTKQPLIGASVAILNVDPIIGALTDVEGYYVLENVPLGRVNIEVAYLGYESKLQSNIEVGSAKQVIVNFELVESVIQVGAVVVTAQSKLKKDEALNQMALVSAKMCTVEETGRYAGSLNDPARMVSSFAGVTGDAEGNNDIVVRGNSPKGILWRLEGVDIPNPNHFANDGGTGGPINALNSAMLDNSDFFSGAFTSEYGNAFSGVFDMRLRTGNNEKYENTFSIGVLGTDFTMEGPFSKNYKGSYLINYRYSSLDLLDKAGLVDFYGVPKYQDGSFKLNLPTEKFGNFTAFGLFGISNIAQTLESADETEVLEEADFGANLHVYGITNRYLIGDKSYWSNTISYQSTKSDLDYRQQDSAKVLYHAYDERFNHSFIKYSTYFNSKISARSVLKIGAIYTDLGYNIRNTMDLEHTGDVSIVLDSKGNSGLFQSYVNWKYRFSENITLITGVHYMNFLLNNNQTVEPRLGLKYQASPTQNFTLGAGLHSKTEALSTYFIQIDDEFGNKYKPNEDLGLSKSAHVVLGYNNRITKQHNLKVEVYYQHLYNLAVENDITSSLALSNFSYGWLENDFVNKGTGRNYGLELTLERFYSNNFYYLVTASLYDSKITALDGVERDSRFNGKYAGNVLIGKEWEFGKDGKSKSFGVNLKLAYIGGKYYTPLNLEQSKIDKESVYYDDKMFSKKGDDIVQANFSCSYKVNRLKTRHEFKIDIQNVINYQARTDEYYDEVTNDVAYYYQLPLLPSLIYAIQF